jgi:extracellular elastinolytic metalloproteinase
VLLSIDARHKQNKNGKISCDVISQRFRDEIRNNEKSMELCRQIAKESFNKNITLLIFRRRKLTSLCNSINLIYNHSRIIQMKFNEIDKRKFSENRVTSDRTLQLEKNAKEVTEKLPGDHKITIKQMDKTTNNPSEIISESAPVPKNEEERKDYAKRANQYLHALAPVLGFEKGQPVDLKMDPTVQITSAETKVVHAQQRYLSKDIFQSGMSVSFDANDSIKGVTGNVITIDQNLPTLPQLSSEDAVSIAFGLISELPSGQKDQFGEPLTIEKSSLDTKGLQVVVNPEGDPAMTTYYKGPDRKTIKARLLWFELAPNDLRLSWEVLVSLEDSLQFRTIVDATKNIKDTDNKQDVVLYHKVVTKFLKAKLNVYRVNGGHNREMVDCPIALDQYQVKTAAGRPLPSPFPDFWVDIIGTTGTTNISTIGNCVFAHLGFSPQTFSGILQNETVTFDPQDPLGDDQKILNIFYYNCVMHDFFYILGFREQEGNFQRDNLGRGGLAADRVDARSHPATVVGTANMGTPPDGRSPVMNMGLVARTNRHTAFDSDVVFHEFMHGVTNRLVGGALDDGSLENPQSGGMGEGWGDYVACCINNKEVVGDWVVNKPTGIRNNTYSSTFPHNFGHLGRTIGGVDYSEVHNIGEIWCATLLEMNRNLNDIPLSMQLVVDALKLSPTNPSFLNMRDSILKALDEKLANNELSSERHSTAKTGIWKAFAKFGMGPTASSNGSQLDGIVPDFNVPT